MNYRVLNDELKIDTDKINTLIAGAEPEENQVYDVLNRAMKLKGLSFKDVALLLRVESEEVLKKVLSAAGEAKKEIYGNRMVIFAPLYTGNRCSNECLYCAFRSGNKMLKRVILNMQQIEAETVSLLKEGHKRLLMLCGESRENPLDYFLDAIDAVYRTKWNNHSIRRINVEIAPLETDEFVRLKKAKIGTYICFQETYNRELYGRYHLSGPKSDYQYRLNVMDRAMEGGIDDVGIGALFGLGDYRFEVLAMIEHANHLEKKFGCGPHTVSVPRLEPADGSEISANVPYPVSDRDFKKIVAILRLALPYTGIILSTRENEELRTELFSYGISQISAGSRTNPGAYSGENDSTGQFSLGDHRSLDEVVSSLVDKGYVPSFCTGCYRKGRVGHDFMDMAKPGLIKDFCQPNATFTFKEYLNDFASKETAEKGNRLIAETNAQISKPGLRSKVDEYISRIQDGERDLYL